MWTRQKEDALVQRCISAAADKREPSDADEADVFRLVAQLVHSRYPEVSATLDQASKSFFKMHTEIQPRKFPDVVKAGLVSDLPRLRILLERKLCQFTGSD